MSIDLDAIKARAEAAPAKPWTLQQPHEDDDYYVAGTDDPSDEFYGMGEVRIVQDIYGKPIAEFIAHAPQDIGALVAEVERLTAALNDIRDRLNHQDFDQSPGAGDIEAIVRAALGGGHRG